MNSTDKSICDKSVFNQLFETHSETLCNYLYYQCGDLYQSEDLTQEAFIKLWKNCKKVLFEKAKGFLFAVAKNAFYNEVAHKKVVLQYAKTQPQKISDHETPEFKFEEDEYLKKLQTAIAKLPNGQREVFLLNRVDKKTYKEMSEILGISQTAVEKRMQKALQKMRLIIKDI